jgi:hypothetical protein
MSTVYALSYASGFAGVSAMIVHTALYYGKILRFSMSKST